MRHFNILIAIVAILITSCTKDEVYHSYQPSTKGGIQIVGAVEDYEIKSVGTRADDDIPDSYISEMTMFIFKGNGELLQGYSDKTCNDNNKCSSAINIQRGNPTFLVDTEEGILADLSGTSNTSMVYYKNDAEDLGACKIYIVANVWHQLQNKVNSIKTLSDLEKIIYDADESLSMPMSDDTHYRGFPMIGTHLDGSFKLKKGDDNEGNAVATIPLKKLYSKVNFTMQINANQVVANQIPKFTISKVEVFNVPKKVRLGRNIDKNGKPVYGTTNTDDYITEMGIDGTYTPSDYYYYSNSQGNAEPAFVIDQFNKKTIYHSTSFTTDDVIEFGFYMPEHKVTPNTITYPDNIDDEFKQYYKPAGVGESRNGDGSISTSKIATFVRIHGSYTDHNGQILGVKYDIYLGQNNTDDFTIKRNQLLNNKLIITGLTNHKDAYPDVEGNVSIDHRVEIDDRGFNLSMERTAILDAHFEVRPLDIELSPNSQMTITIPEGYRSWIAMENDDAARSGVNSQLYVNTSTPRKGVRKYFTTNLVSELNANEGYTIILSNNVSGATTTKTFRIWFYIDENPNVYDKTGATTPNQDSDGTYTVSNKQYRNCPVQFSYMGTDKDGNTLVKNAIVNFQQWNLWRVWNSSGTRYYDIEHEEEYLNNYASDQQYGGTQDGMPWGLEGVVFSDYYKSFYLETNFSDISNALMETSKPYYDFYITKEEANKTSNYRPYAGWDFSNDIMSKLLYETIYDTDGKVLTNSNYISLMRLIDDPKSAVEYCYNKNKRIDNSGTVIAKNPDGTYNTSNVKWYLPAIDEIEDITASAYDEFDRAFQGNWYWSSQPAFDRYKYIYNAQWGLVDQVSGFFYQDDVSNARATKSVFSATQGWIPAASGSDELINSNTVGTHTWTSKIIWVNHNYTANSSYSQDNLDAGNQSRKTSNRIRAVYRSGTK